MAETASATVREAIATVGAADPTKRDFLKLLTGSAAVIGAGALAWPFIDSMNPARDVLALSSIDVELAPVVEGQAHHRGLARQADLRAPPHRRGDQGPPRTCR